VFDISFAELMMIAVVGLLVIGPDKLPQVARTVGTYVGRLQRYVAQIKEEVNREARFEDLQNLQQDIKRGASQVEASIMDGAREVKEAVASAEKASTEKPISKKPVTKKTTTKKSVARKSTAKKPPVKKAPAKTTNKPAAKKVAAKQKVEKA